MTLSPVYSSLLFASGLAILLFLLAPKPPKDLFAKPKKKRNLSEKIQQSLRLAGVFDQTPTVVMAALGLAIFVVGFISSVVIGNIFGFFVGVIAVPAAFHFALMNRQRKFMTRATNELVPFLNRMVTSVKAGKPAQSAYMSAVYESKELRKVLNDSAVKITAGVPFREALIQTIPLLPLRMWSVFVRQLEAHDEMGGNLGDAIEKSVKQVNTILSLQAEARADYAAQDRQQKLIALISVVGTLAFGFMVDKSIIAILWTTLIGFIILGIAFGVMGFGIWLGRKQLRDFEKQANI